MKKDNISTFAHGTLLLYEQFFRFGVTVNGSCGEFLYQQIFERIYRMEDDRINVCPSSFLILK
jgi:hypothetical protein